MIRVAAAASDGEDDWAIDVKNVSKRFKLYDNFVTGPIKEWLFFWRRRQYHREFLAVKNVSFTLRRGEVVGIIGANGAGKTTLLKLIANLLPLDTGSIKVRGNVTALLALGIGVHPEFTGRENIYYSGLLLGMSHDEILDKTPAIIEFSEIGDFIDQPFRTYSSGMRARLLFSISMSIDPDILIVDEALATGDVKFLHKSSRRIRELCQSGATILFVSHNLKQIESLCQRCIVMEKGSVVFDGDTKDALPCYIDTVYRGLAERIESENAKRHRWPFKGTGEIVVEDAYFMTDGTRTVTLPIGRSCELHVDFEAFKDLDSVALCIEVYSEKSPITYAFLPFHEPFVIGDLSRFAVKGGKAKLVLSFPKFIIGDGLYWLGLEFFPGQADYQFSYDTCYCYYANTWSFQAVHQDYRRFGRGTLAEIPSVPIEIRSR